jgi:hypothetical protein
VPSPFVEASAITCDGHHPLPVVLVVPEVSGAVRNPDESAHVRSFSWVDDSARVGLLPRVLKAHSLDRTSCGQLVEPPSCCAHVLTNDVAADGMSAG